MVRLARALSAALLLAGCDDTVNNGDASTPILTLRVSLSSADAEGDQGVYEARDPRTGSLTAFGPFLSGDGSAVAFMSASGQIHPESVAGVPFIYVKNLKSRELTLASRADGAAGAPAEAYLVGLSRDGRRVAFISSFLDDEGKGDGVYVRDLDTNETILASRATGLSGDGVDGRVTSAVLSADGRHVAFATDAPGLEADDADTWNDVFVRDLDSGVTVLASRETGGAKFTRHSAVLAIAGDGSSVVIQKPVYDPGPPQIGHPGPPSLFVRSLSASPLTTTINVSGGDNRAAMSDDGLLVAFSTSVSHSPEDVDGHEDVYVRDMSTGGLDLVSRATGPSGAKGIVNGAIGLAMSGDGRFVAFESEAANLVPGDTNLAVDIFLRDRLQSTTARASVRTFGSQIPKGGQCPSVSGPARAVAFFSESDDIVDDDANESPDIFVRSYSR